MIKTPEDICPDFPEWPERWHGVKKDIPYGQGILDAMRPFVNHLIARGFKKQTIRTHMDNLWLLGGEIVRSVSMFDRYDIPPEKNLRQNVDEEGGPYCRHLHSEAEEKSYDATCRKLHKFLFTDEVRLCI
jgi:hypothetical protein